MPQSTAVDPSDAYRVVPSPAHPGHPEGAARTSTDGGSAPEAPAPAAAARPWRAAAWSAFAVWLASTVAHLGVSALAWLPRGGQPPDASDVVLNWNRWDAGLYVWIAAEGYDMGPGFPAFFPLYPLLIRVFDAILPGNAIVSALVVANVSAFGALVLLHRLASYEFGHNVAQRATFYLAAFPMGFFLFIGYNASLFILLTVGALYAGRRGHWWVAGALGGLASATRLFGLLLLLPLAIEYVRQHGRRPLRLRPDVLGLALVPVGLAAYALYCWRVLGNPLAFSAAQDDWGRRYTVPGQAWLDAVHQSSGLPLLHPTTLGTVLDAGTVLVAAVLLILCVCGPWRFRRDQLYLVVHAALALVLLLSTEVGHGRMMQSSARYTLEAVAVFLVLARMGANHLVDRVVVVTGVSLQAVFLVIFMSGTFLVA
jgi:Mannosyltransferase (PIG-V)